MDGLTCLVLPAKYFDRRTAPRLSATEKNIYKKGCVCECCVSDLFLFDVFEIASCQRIVRDKLLLIMETKPRVVQVREAY